jgi:hypothetical protein
VIEFHLDGRSGVAPYRRLIHQVGHAPRLGQLREGDQLPKVKDVVAGLDDESIEALFASMFRSASEEEIA